jgi:hypothetical protein
LTIQIEHGNVQRDGIGLDREDGFLDVRLAEAEAGVLGEAVAFRRDAQEVRVELLVPVLVVIEGDGVAASESVSASGILFPFQALDQRLL